MVNKIIIKLIKLHTQRFRSKEIILGTSKHGNVIIYNYIINTSTYFMVQMS